MKIYIFADLEGCSGVSGEAYVNGNFAAAGAGLMLHDINTCVEACFAAGADSVVVRDGHGSGVNFRSADLDERAALVQGAVPGVRFPGCDAADGMILLGYHAMAGTMAAVLEHSYSSRTIQNLYLNGRRIGEIGMDAAIAGEHNIPVLLVTGDDKACAEAKDFLPQVETCCVKQAFAAHAALCKPLAECRKALMLAVKQAIRRIDEIKPVKTPYPCTVRWENTERTPIPLPGNGVKVIDGRTFERTGGNLEQVFLA